jgi:NADH-quinone oxidoreductase subunit N
MNLGAFAVVALLSRDREEGSRLSSFAGLGYRQPILAGAMTFFLLSLAGLPPTAGFTGKILILATDVNGGYPWLAVLLIVGTAISAYAYFKIVLAMYGRTTGAQIQRAVKPSSALPWVGVAICAVATLVLGLYPILPSDIVPLVK